MVLSSHHLHARSNRYQGKFLFNRSSLPDAYSRMPGAYTKTLKLVDNEMINSWNQGKNRK